MTKKSKPELLAPAGSLESFFAAIESGADALYAGLNQFSARARAKNFTIQQMEKMNKYAKSLGKKVYVTINTLIKENELPELVETVAALEEMNIGGVILQDIAVARVIRNHFSSIPLHASTQLGIHNLAGVKIVEELGFERVVLARELPLEDVAAISAASKAEIEIFVHGALCFSISGQCFFSSYLGGHSGNRGRCAQPCRRLYSHRGKDGHYFSTNDLSAIEIVPELVKSGVASLKIEGRMKSAEYVASVVSAYRKILDATAGNEKEALKSAKEILKSSFGRSTTKGFLGCSKSSEDIANPWQKGGTGRYAGGVKSVRNRKISFDAKTDIHVGDRLRLQPKSDMAGQGWSVREIIVRGKKVLSAKAGELIEIETPFDAIVGDPIYKVASNEGFTLSDAAAMRRLESVENYKLPCSIEASYSAGQLFLKAFVNDEEFKFTYKIGELEPAKSSSMEDVLKSQFSRTGDTPFTLLSLKAENFPSILIPSKLFKEIRRGFYKSLEEDFNRLQKRGFEAKKRKALLSLQREQHKNVSAKDTLSIVVDSPKDWRYPLQAGADSTIIALSKSALHSLAATVGQMRGYEEKIVWQLPFIIYDQDFEFYKDAVKSLSRINFRNFEATNISHFYLLQQFENLNISAGYRCFSMNSEAIIGWSELGAKSTTLYIEDDSQNISTILAENLPVNTAIIAYSPIPVMTTKISMKDVHSNTALSSDRGEKYTVSRRDSLQSVFAEKPFSITEYHHELRRNGANRFVIDLTKSDRKEWESIIKAFRESRAIDGCTEFNFKMGLI